MLSSPVGNYNINATGGADNNYTFNISSGVLEILPATLSLDIPDTVRPYNEVNPAVQIDYSGFKLEETDTVLNVLPSIIFEATTDSDVGSYSFYTSGGSAMNYILLHDTATLNVVPANALITISNLASEADGTPKEVTVVTEPANLNFIVTYNGETTAPSEPGSYQVQVTIDETNYVGEATATLVINSPNSIIDRGNLVEVHVYPNPATDKIFLSGKVHITGYQLINSLGKVILEGNGSSISVQNMTPGIYLIKTIADNRVVDLDRVVIK
jgi:hypothetical protein